MRRIFSTLLLSLLLCLVFLVGTKSSVYAGGCVDLGIGGGYYCYTDEQGFLQCPGGYDPNYNPVIAQACCQAVTGSSCENIIASFPPGTLIKTPVGSVKIEELKVGDVVSSFKENNILDSKIRKIFKYERDFYYSLSAGDYSVKASAEHPFYIGGGEFKVISKLVSGDTVYVLENDKLVSKTVTSNTKIDKSTPVYNLTVDNTNTYFAGGFAVHNKGGNVDPMTGGNCPSGYRADYSQPTRSFCTADYKDLEISEGDARKITGCCNNWKEDEDGNQVCGGGNYLWTDYACVPICDPNDWGAWSACSASCGPGTQSRTNACGTSQSQSCQVNDPNIWGAWSTCTVNCGTGTQSQTNQCGTSQSQNCNTQVCGPWIKLKDSSFVSANNLFNMISSIPDPYDDDDTTDQYFIVDKGGVVAAPVINLDISNVAPTAKTGNPEYKALYTPTYSMTPALFLSYVKARKEYKVITNLGEISGSGIYVFNGDVSIDSGSSPFNTAVNIVLLSTGTVTVSRVAPSTTFTPGGTVALIVFNSTRIVQNMTTLR